MTTTRLPPYHRPGFDCIRDNANCPGCKRSPGDHGVSGGVAVYAVRDSDRHTAVSLEVMLTQYPPTVPTYPGMRGGKTNRDDPPHGGALVLHRPADGGELCHVIDVPCAYEIIGYIRGDEMYKHHGSQDPHVDPMVQPESLWLALEAELARQLDDHEHKEGPRKECQGCIVADRKALALYIFDWLRRRNGNELDDAIGEMSLADYENALEELEMILEHGGKPPNWVS